MTALARALIALGVAGALSLVAVSPGFAKAKAKTSHHRLKSPAYRYSAYPPPAPVVQCLHGVWDPYGVRCDPNMGGL